MMLTYTISGTNLDELPKDKLYQYFSSFGELSDYIVRYKANSLTLDRCSTMATNQTVSFTIVYRFLSQPESRLIDFIHCVSGIEVTCSKLEMSCSISDRKVFIKYLDKRAAVQDIINDLAIFGEIDNVHVSMKKDKSMNLGLCNVLFKSKESTLKILGEQNVFINNKKVKVEPFKSKINTESNTSLWLEQARNAYFNAVQSRYHSSTPQIIGKSVFQADGRSFSEHLKNPKIRLPALTIPLINDTDSCKRDKSAPLTPLIYQGSCKMTLTRGTGDSRDQFDMMTRNGEFLLPLNYINSLDFSLIEEECEDSPRPKRNTQTYEQLCNIFSDTKKSGIAQVNAIISFRGENPTAAIDSKPPIDKDSFHSVKPTSKKYFQNPRHHLLGLARNHKAENLCFSKARVGP